MARALGGLALGREGQKCMEPAAFALCCSRSRIPARGAHTLTRAHTHATHTSHTYLLKALPGSLGF